MINVPINGAQANTSDHIIRTNEIIICRNPKMMTPLGKLNKSLKQNCYSQ